MKKRELLWGVAQLAALLFWILIWFLVSEKVDLPFILPSPIQVLRRLWELLFSGQFYITVWTSLIRIFSGFLAGVILGFVLGFLAFHSRILNALIFPVMTIIKATPVASFILVVILWIQRDSVPGFISLLMVLPIIWQNTLLGFQKRDGRLGEMAKAFQFGKWKTLWRIDLPQVFPFVLSAAKTGMGLAWKAGVAAEVLALPNVSIGEMIYNAKLYLETVDLYAWTLSIIILSILLEKLFFFLLEGKKGGHRAENK